MEQNDASNEAQIKNYALEQPEVTRWLEGKKESTKRVYFTAIRTSRIISNKLNAFIIKNQVFRILIVS